MYIELIFFIKYDTLYRYNCINSLISLHFFPCLEVDRGKGSAIAHLHRRMIAVIERKVEEEEGEVVAVEGGDPVQEMVVVVDVILDDEASVVIENILDIPMRDPVVEPVARLLPLRKMLI